MDRTYLPGSARKRILDLMKHGKVTQKDLAQRIDITESALSRFLSGTTDRLDSEYLLRIARCSGFPRIFFWARRRSRIERITKSWSWACLRRRRGISIPEECVRTS